MRPVYETPETIEAEKQAAGKLAKAWGTDFMRNPKFYAIDWCVLEAGKGKMHRSIKGFVEVKRRHNYMETYPTLSISLHKIIAAHEIMSVTGLPVYLAIQWDDILGVANLQQRPSDRSYMIQTGGRTDRNDKDDLEPMAHIDTSYFKDVKYATVDMLPVRLGKETANAEVEF